MYTYNINHYDVIKLAKERNISRIEAMAILEGYLCGITDFEIEDYLKIFNHSMSNGSPVETAIEEALTGIVFRIKLTSSQTFTNIYSPSLN